MKRTVPALLTALLLAAAVQVLFGLAAGWAEGVRSMLWPSEAKRESLEILKDGTLVVEVSTVRGRISKRSWRTIDGAPLVGTPEAMNVFASQLNGVPSARQAATRLTWVQRVRGFWVERAGQAGFGESWYAVSDPSGATRFVGYDVQSNQIVGHFGRRGFVEAPPPPDDQFRLAPSFLTSSRAINANNYQAIEPWSIEARTPIVLLPLPDEVVEIDFVKKRVERVWKGNGAIDVCKLYDHRSTDERESGFAIRTPSHLHLLDRDHRETLSIEIPEAMRDKMLFVGDFGADGVTVLASSFYQRIGYFAKVPAQGPAKVVEVPLDNSLPNERPSWPAIGAMMPQPSCLVAGWLGATHEMVDEGKAPSWGTALASEWPLFWPTLFVVTCLSALLAAAAWRRQRCYGLGHEALWAGFVLLFGVPGWLAYRWHRAWPPLEACPNCGANVPRDRETCLHCKTAFPPPKRESFEIRD